MTVGQSLDPFPCLHVRPERGWVNDPNGLLRVGDRYHVFFQHNPDRPRHEAICWGHVSSTDLLRWEPEPVALRPRPEGPDAVGCWSGVATVDDGVPTLVYTAIRETPTGSAVVLAPADDPADPHLASWTAEPAPVEEMPPVDGIDQVRDPFLFRAGGHRWAVQGAGLTDGTPLVLVYLADDLHAWEYRGVLVEGRPGSTAARVAEADVWECPQLVETGDAWTLVVSQWHRDGPQQLCGVAALVGDLDLSAVADGGGPRFVPASGGPVDTGPDFYAPQVLAEPGRGLLLGWTWEGRGQDEVDAAGWAGALTFPREVSLDGGRLASRPARELTGLRRDVLHDGTVAGGLDVDTPAFEVEAATAGRVSVSLSGPDGVRPVWSGDVAAGGRTLVDGSVVEVFAGPVPHTLRAYPARGERWLVEADVPVAAWRLGLPDAR
ncbi:glycoside hydrolase family 32 protein [Isoptericola sp. BMS4]|uniref:glycoside hydrolase family 32 protein n=1 Tax=Isoptericola sp. BMS4 TaxID=2527875 RepID=UPI0014209760|nr:glycoside hydrolase family 32 protein [Isoptericola sp. BMS4]